MIKLYTAPGACSLAPHIVLCELGLPHEVRIVKWSDTQAREELKKVNLMGQVPTIVTDEGYPLAEGAAIMQYLVSKKPEHRLFPESGKERFKAFEWMSFISTALHKGGFSPLFNPKNLSDNEAHFETIKRVTMERLKTLLQITEERFLGGDYVLGKDFTVVDATLFTVLRWSSNFKIDLSAHKKLGPFMERMSKRPSVVAAMKAEGLEN